MVWVPREIQRLTKLARSWGGDIIALPDNVDAELWCSKLFGKNSFESAPFTAHDLGVCYRQKLVVYAGAVTWPEVIHEMGHTFASKRAPDQSNEFKFLGWEYVTAKYIRGAMVDWHAWTGDYELGDETGSKISAAYGELTLHERRELLRDRVNYCLKHGMVQRVGDQLVPLPWRFR